MGAQEFGNARRGKALAVRPVSLPDQVRYEALRHRQAALPAGEPAGRDPHRHDGRPRLHLRLKAGRSTPVRQRPPRVQSSRKKPDWTCRSSGPSRPSRSQLRKKSSASRWTTSPGSHHDQQPLDVSRPPPDRAQIVNGNGTGGNMLGVSQRPGSGRSRSNAATPFAIWCSRVDRRQVGNAEPDAMLLNPMTYQACSRRRQRQRRTTRLRRRVRQPRRRNLGVPVIQSAVVPSKAIVADWGRATTLYVRQGPNVKMSDSDQDDFIRNVVTVLAESRVGLAVFQPSAICEVHLA